MFLSAFRYLRGWVKFSAYGAYPEQFISQLFLNDIEIREVYSNEGIIYAVCPAKQYKRLKKYAKKAGIRIRAAEKHGLPFIINRYHRRIGMAVGVALFAAILWICSLYVWEVKVVGCQSGEEQTILSAAQELGISKGVRKSSIDERAAAEQLRYVLTDTAWAAVNISNCIVQIEVTERISPPDTAQQYFCNVVAERDGTVVSVQAYSGKPQVQVGDGVTQGQLLISGVVEDQYGKSTFVHADGEVIAKTRHSISVTVPYESTELLPNGQQSSQRRLEFFWLDIPLGIKDLDKSPPYEQFERTENKSQLKLFDVTLPVSMTEVSFNELAQTQVIYDAETAEQEAISLLEKQEQLAFSGSKILSRELEQIDNGDSFTLTAYYECEENVSLKQEFTIY